MRFAAITLRVVVLLGVMGVFAGLMCADETETFIKEIIAGARTDSQRSIKLMEAVSLTEGNKKLQIALLEKSVEYGIKGLRTPDDCSRVQKAVRMLARNVPEKESYWLSQQAQIYRRMHTLAKSKDDKEKVGAQVVDLLIRAGHSAAVKGDWKASLSAYSEARSAAMLYKQAVKDNLSIRLRTIVNLSKAQEQVGKYIAALAKSPDDAELRSNLIKTLLVTLDDPVGAAKYVNTDVDQKYQAYVPLAVKDVSEVPFEGCKSLGDWYHKELSKNTVSSVKSNMLKRAKAYLQRALSLYDKSDISSAAMKHRISQIESELVKRRVADPLICVYCFAAGKIACPLCMIAGKSTGKLQCAKCKSTGRMKCASCNGIYGLKCKACGGKGIVYVIVKDYFGKRRMPRTCSACSGQRYIHYSVRSKHYRSGTCSNCSYHSPKGSDTCTACDGGGGSKDCPKCGGDETLRCTHCTSASGI
ncbi:MAG: hypothetical protein ISS69_06660 [Phycisphaerae bacterium]|nr:hypothetical protein [Planctomycetota bacterium]MBL7219774.1 hypothetical protein [Phycisphaerae bacterium]